MKNIYMDFAATSPVKPEVFKAMKPYFSQKFGNPSSIHFFGREARGVIDKSRKIVANFLNCQIDEIIFTSGGTESDNLAIRGIIESCIGQRPRSKRSKCSNCCDLNKRSDRTSKAMEQLPHIITSAFEHHAVLHTCQDLEKFGLAEVTYIKPDKEGIIHASDVKKAIKPNTILVSIMYVNNEIGTIQPITEIAKAISGHKLYFHTDAVQAIGYLDCDVKKLGVDMLSLSAHKFGGPKGIGLLFVKKGTQIEHLQTGGAQEFNKRAGTENVAGIVGLGKAIELVYRRSLIVDRQLKKLQDYFVDQIEENISNIILNGSRKLRSPNNINFSFLGAEGEAILLNLDLLGVAASSGSACTSGSLEPSHVLTAIGRKAEDAHGSIRFTINEKTTRQEIDYVVKNLIKIVKKLRIMNPLYEVQK